MNKRLFICVLSLFLFAAVSYGQKKTEYTVRANVMLMDCSVNATGGFFVDQNLVLGLGAGWGQEFRPYHCVGQRATFYAYQRIYIPLGQKRKVFLYSDLMVGGIYVYDRKMGDSNQGYANEKNLRGYISWQPGVAIRTWGETKVFLGISLGPTFGLHGGLSF